MVDKTRGQEAVIVVVVAGRGINTRPVDADSDRGTDSPMTPCLAPAFPDFHAPDLLTNHKHPSNTRINFLK